MYYMIFRRSRDKEQSADEADSSRLAPLNPAHLTHEPVRRRWSWIRFVAGAAVGGLVIEAFRLGLFRGL